jgi:hypothetical protein
MQERTCLKIRSYVAADDIWFAVTVLRNRDNLSTLEKFERKVVAAKI